MLLNRLFFSFCLLYTIAFIIPLPDDRGFFLDTYFPVNEVKEIVTVSEVKDKTPPPINVVNEKLLYVKSIKQIYKREIPLDLLNYIEKVSKQHQLDYNLVIGLIAAESSFYNNSTSSVGAVGYMQVWPKWHQDKIAGRDIRNPYVNIEVGIRFLKECIDKRGGIYEGLACYNGASSKASANRYYNAVMARSHTLKVSNVGLVLSEV